MAISKRILMAASLAAFFISILISVQTFAGQGATGIIAGIAKAPVIRDELAGQPVEQARVRRRRAVDAEVARGADQPAAEVVVPEPVDDHAGEQGAASVFDVCDPFSKCSALQCAGGFLHLGSSVFPIVLRNSLETHQRWKPEFHLDLAIVEIAASEQPSRFRFGVEILEEETVCTTGELCRGSVAAVKHAHELIILARGEGVVFMIMASSASGGDS